jgi:hypothetical protein
VRVTPFFSAPDVTRTQDQHQIQDHLGSVRQEKILLKLSEITTGGIIKEKSLAPTLIYGKNLITFCFYIRNAIISKFDV